jgi:uncharacterized protein
MLNDFQALAQLQIRPTQRPFMRQSWQNLAFFHRKFDPDIIASLIPKPLTLHTHQSNAYIGFVPFVMANVRLAGLPPLPSQRRFLETNIRTYVLDSEGRPGVYFFSLDCTDPLSIAFARSQFGLNYLSANLTINQTQDQITYAGTRTHHPQAAYRATIHINQEATPAPINSLEFWLLERYLLFAFRQGKLLTGQVHHAPYQIITPTQTDCLESMITATTRLPHHTHWDSILYSTGVDVDVFRPTLS